MSISEKTDAIRRCWDDFADNFGAFDPIMRQSWQMILTQMALSSASSVLEVGCGRGQCSLAISKSIPAFSKLTATDLSPKMVKITQNVLPMTASVQVADAANLRHIIDSSMDRYIANMTLQIVPDPDAMLRESRRVLTGDGIAAFSVWGDKQASVMMSAKPDNEQHAHFHLGHDPVALRNRVLAAGFSRVVMVRQPCILELWEAERAVAWWAKIDHKTLPNDEQWFQEMIANYQNALNEGKPIMLESLIILARP